METLASELAKLLNITVDTATQLYPILKEQFINYKIISSIQEPCLIVAILSLIVCCVIVIVLLVDGIVDDESPSVIKKILLISFIVLIVSSIIYLICNILTVKMAPDILLIKEFLNE